MYLLSHKVPRPIRWDPLKNLNCVQRHQFILLPTQHKTQDSLEELVGTIGNVCLCFLPSLSSFLPYFIFFLSFLRVTCMDKADHPRLPILPSSSWAPCTWQLLVASSQSLHDSQMTLPWPGTFLLPAYSIKKPKQTNKTKKTNLQKGF